MHFAGLKPLSQHWRRLNSKTGRLAYATAFRVKERAATARRSQNSPATAKCSLDRIAGNDSSAQQIVDTCRKIVNKDIPILLLGETGVGKDTLARAIHAESDRARGAYVAVNCAAIPATLLASELFGYAPGTFTGGATSGKVGKIAASHGGTLFLDEIGDMPLDLQAHLLRVLEDRAVTPLGSTNSVPVDLKIICATHCDLPVLVEAGRFRKDLYYRIRGAQFRIPALRERTDFEELVTSIVREEARSEADQPIAASDALALMKRYPWPGNIRELRNVIRITLSLTEGEREFRARHLPDQLLEYARTNNLASSNARLEQDSDPVSTPLGSRVHLGSRCTMTVQRTSPYAKRTARQNDGGFWKSWKQAIGTLPARQRRSKSAVQLCTAKFWCTA